MGHDKAIFELAQVRTVDGIPLHGLLSPGETNKPLLLFVHGAASNFYNNDFLEPLALAARREGMGVLSINTRGHDCLWGHAEQPESQSGQLLELMEDARLDLDAWIAFLETRGYMDIALAGQALGTQKVVRYISEGQYASRIGLLLLLGIFDNCFATSEQERDQLQSHLRASDRAIAEGRGRELCPHAPFPVSHQAFVSQAADDDFCNMFDFYRENYSHPALSAIHLPIRMISGGEDEWLRSPAKAAQTLSPLLSDFGYAIINGANHDYEGYEDEVTKAILGFVHEYQVSRSRGLGLGDRRRRDSQEPIR